jgi:hypothetical protein
VLLFEKIYLRSFSPDGRCGNSGMMAWGEKRVRPALVAAVVFGLS